MNDILHRLEACDTPAEMWALRDELIDYIEELQGENSALAGVLEDIHDSESGGDT